MPASKEEARIEFAKAHMAYRQICKKVSEVREILPPEDKRSPEEIAFWMMLCNKSSKLSKERIRAKQIYENFDSIPKSVGEDRIQELEAEADFKIEKEEMEKELNPKKKPIFDLDWAKPGIEAASKFIPINGPPNPLIKNSNPVPKIIGEEEKDTNEQSS